MNITILSLGITAPGIKNLDHFKENVLNNKPFDLSESLEKYSPSFLPANERRRTTPTIKLALKTAEEALNNYQKSTSTPVKNLPTIFVSKDGDTMISAKMCEATSEEEPLISPTQFHNSVHNAPAGYWMIGQQKTSAASAISAGNEAIANGLLEAFLQSEEVKKPVLIVFYDLTIDQKILSTSLGIEKPMFSFSMVLSVSEYAKTSSYPFLSFEFVSELAEEKSTNPYKGLPAAEGFPLLKSIIELVSNQTTKQHNFIFPLNKDNFIKVCLSATS